MSTIEKGQTVAIDTINQASGYLLGKTIEEVCSSPCNSDPERKVVRVRWEDDSETIENVKDLY